MFYDAYLAIVQFIELGGNQLVYPLAGLRRLNSQFEDLV